MNQKIRQQEKSSTEEREIFSFFERQTTDFERNFCEREFLRTRRRNTNPLVVFPRKLRTNLNARFIFFHRAGGNTFLQNLLFPPAERERDLFKKEFIERERAFKDVYVYNIYKERKKEREILGRSRRFVSESHIVLVRDKRLD